MYEGQPFGSLREGSVSSESLASWFGPARQMVRPGWWSVPAGTAATLAATLDQVRFTPLWVPSGGVSIDRIAAEVTAAGLVGAVVRLGVYDSKDNGEPSDLVLDAGTADATTTGVKEIIVDKELDGGLKWLVCVSQVAACTIRARTGVPFGLAADTSANAITSAVASLTQATVSGALPATAGATGTAAEAAAVSVRFV